MVALLAVQHAVASGQHGELAKDVVGADGTALTLTPSMKAFVESTDGGLRPGVIGIATTRGDQLTEWQTLTA